MGTVQARFAPNVEWELLGGVHAEIQDAGLGVPILELDASSMTPEAMAERVFAWRDGDTLPQARGSSIGWPTRRTFRLEVRGSQSTDALMWRLVRGCHGLGTISQPLGASASAAHPSA